MKKLYYVDLHSSCYGRRVYVQRETLNTLSLNDRNTVVNTLNECSVWGGWDKDHGGWLGWELPLNPRVAGWKLGWIKAALKVNGFTQAQVCPWN